jgi:hypothetical protein
MILPSLFCAWRRGMAGRAMGRRIDGGRPVAHIGFFSDFKESFYGIAYKGQFSAAARL